VHFHAGHLLLQFFAHLCRGFLLLKVQRQNCDTCNIYLKRNDQAYSWIHVADNVTLPQCTWRPWNLVNSSLSPTACSSQSFPQAGAPNPPSSRPCTPRTHHYNTTTSPHRTHIGAIGCACHVQGGACWCKLHLQEA
jgi:hypothetical protein